MMFMFSEILLEVSWFALGAIHASPYGPRNEEVKDSSFLPSRGIWTNHPTLHAVVVFSKTVLRPSVSSSPVFAQSVKLRKPQHIVAIDLMSHGPFAATFHLTATA